MEINYAWKISDYFFLLYVYMKMWYKRWNNFLCICRHIKVLTITLSKAMQFQIIMKTLLSETYTDVFGCFSYFLCARKSLFGAQFSIRDFRKYSWLSIIPGRGHSLYFFPHSFLPVCLSYSEIACLTTLGLPWKPELKQGPPPYFPCLGFKNKGYQLLLWLHLGKI